MITASKAQLRDFYINYHGFDEFFDADGATAVDRIFERLRSIQFDPLNVCGRNAELVLFSRNRNVTKTDLFDALYKRRALADAWDKMMCIIPSAELASFAYVRERMAEDYRLTINRRAQNDCYDCMDEVYSFIEKNGPVLITDIPSRKTNDGRWGSTKIANVCCDYMWYCGRVAVAYKKGVVKAFDTAERVRTRRASARYSSRRSTISFGTESSSNRCSGSITRGRCTCPPKSAGSDTTCCRLL